MTTLPLIIAPDPIFKSTSIPVDSVDDSTRRLMDDLHDTVISEYGIGIAAPMVGIKKRIIVTNVKDSADAADNFMYFVNPVITDADKQTQSFEEGSLCFPGISADISRPKTITVEYLDYNGKQQTLKADGFLAQVIQHEMDYLDGKVFIDYLSRTKRSMLLKKMQKHIKNPSAHVHGPNCGHNH